MRIIAGQHKSRKLLTLKGENTRPTMDHVKEACFARLGPWIVDREVLDLFSGSGNIGLEALSRGARQAVFVEGSVKAFPILKANVDGLDYQDQAELYRMDAFDACRYLRKQARTFDFIYLDPPYQKIDMVKLMQAVRALTHEQTKLVYECLVEDEQLIFEGFELSHSASYGRIRLDTYRRQG